RCAKCCQPSAEEIRGRRKKIKKRKVKIIKPVKQQVQGPAFQEKSPIAFSESYFSEKTCFIAQHLLNKTLSFFSFFLLEKLFFIKGVSFENVAIELTQSFFLKDRCL